MKPKDVAITLRLSEIETTKFYLEYLRLCELPKIPFIHEKLRGPQGISLKEKTTFPTFLELSSQSVYKIFPII
jgi:hypothetical protein